MSEGLRYVCPGRCAKTASASLGLLRRRGLDSTLTVSTVVRLARRVVRRLIRRLGFDLVRRSSSNAPHALRQAILDREAISAVIDGGAFVGWYARELRGTGYRGRIASFEPLREPFAQLQRAAEADERWEVHRLGLGAEDGQRVLNVAGNS